MNLSNLHPETISIHSANKPTGYNENSSALFLNSSFRFESAEDAAAAFSGETDAHIYSRFSNPNTDELAVKMARLEGCEAALCFASGMSAVFNALASVLKNGDHLIACKNIFGNSLAIIQDFLPNWGIEYSLLSIKQFNKELAEHIKPNTKAVFVETPTNPSLRLLDLKKIGEEIKGKDIAYIVDNCFATPFLQQPAKFGADLVLHSATKFIDGQGRVLGGIVAGTEDRIAKCYQFLRRTGPSLSPFNAHVLSKSLDTLSLRVNRQSETAKKIALKLSDNPTVEKVYYPELESHPDHLIYKNQMNKGGALVAFYLKGDLNKTRQFVNALNLFTITANLGDVRSIVTHPASTTHSKLSVQAREEVGITDNLVRISCGLEHAEDLWNDIQQALATV